MADVESTKSIVDWVKDGSVVAFAAAVLWELRQQRNERNQQTKIITQLMQDLHSAMAILLDRAGLKRKPTHPVLPIIEEKE